MRITLFRRELKNISITLYDQIGNDQNADEIAESILLLFSDERGAYKRTYSKRFEEFDKIILKYLLTIFQEKDQLRFHDVAISDGRTALDFFEKISLIFSHIQYIASDYSPNVYVLERNNCKVTLSREGKILEILFPPFVFNKIKRDSIRHYPLNHLILAAVEFFIVSPLVKKYRLKKIKAKELMLFAPNVLNASKKDSRFILSQHDLLKPFAEKFHIIRAMNVLNTSYFSQDDFKKVIKNLHDGLFEAGILIAGSNQEANSAVCGGVYRKTKTGFERQCQSELGLEIDNLLMNYRAPSKKNS